MHLDSYTPLSLVNTIFTSTVQCPCFIHNYHTSMIIMFFCVASTCDHGDVRLYGGYSKSDGHAEVCINGQWTKICYNGQADTTSIIFCRQLLGRENVGKPIATYCI